jgi:hypothetical protein
MSVYVEFHDGFTLHPDQYYQPSYRISPFRTQDIAVNAQLPESQISRAYWNARFPMLQWTFTTTGKEAISLCLQALNLQPNDLVSILTTSQNFYVSGCVTREIEKVCKWNRELSGQTSVIFVIHEFGHPHREMSKLLKTGLPIIEDACHSFYSDTPEHNMGSGDFIFFSLPKAIPIQMGGVVFFKKKYSLQSKLISQNKGLEQYLLKTSSFYLQRPDQIAEKRRRNFLYLKQLFAALGFAPRFELMDRDVPGVFMFQVSESIDLDQLKAHCWRHGIECSVFYGERAFFLPCHDRLQDLDMNYFVLVVRKFLETI